MASGRGLHKINGEQKYLWRAIDQDGRVLDILVQNRRDTAAARRFFRRPMKNTGPLLRLPQVTEQPGGEQPPARQREGAMKGFRSVGGAQRFLSVLPAPRGISVGAP